MSDALQTSENRNFVLGNFKEDGSEASASDTLLFVKILLPKCQVLRPLGYISEAVGE